jgi:hypothetical protein
VAIEADLTQCYSERCENAKVGEFAAFIRYFVAVENGNFGPKALVVGTKATEDSLPDKFVFYIAEDFRNYFDNVQVDFNPAGAACSIL